MNSIEIAVWLTVTLLALITLFQIALIAGAPWGEYAFGGRYKVALPRNLKIGSVISCCMYVGVACHFLAQIGVFPQLLDSTLNTLANWSIVGIFSLALIMNTITPSKKERLVWAPIGLVLLITSVIIAIGA
jgi:hypothetical protein